MDRDRLHYGWVVIFTGLLITIGAHGFGRMSYTLILPAMRDGLHFNYEQLGLLATGNFIGYLLMALIGGFLAARFGTRVVISLALVFMGITIILTGFADTFGFAFATRLLTGMGNGAAYVPAMALGSIWFALHRRGFATGIVSAGIGAGTMIAGLIVPPILLAYGAQDGWRYAWFYLGVPVLVIAAVAWILLRNRPDELGLHQVGDATGIAPSQDKPKAVAAPLNWGTVYKMGARLVSWCGLFHVRFFVHHLYDVFCRLFGQGHGNRRGRGRRLVGYGWGLEHLLRSAMGRHIRQAGSRKGRGAGIPGARLILFDLRAISGENGLLHFRCTVWNHGLEHSHDHGRHRG